MRRYDTADLCAISIAFQWNRVMQKWQCSGDCTAIISTNAVQDDARCILRARFHRRRAFFNNNH